MCNLNIQMCFLFVSCMIIIHNVKHHMFYRLQFQGTETMWSYQTWSQTLLITLRLLPSMPMEAEESWREMDAQVETDQSTKPHKCVLSFNWYFNQTLTGINDTIICCTYMQLPECRNLNWLVNCLSSWIIVHWSKSKILYFSRMPTGHNYELLVRQWGRFSTCSVGQCFA